MTDRHRYLVALTIEGRSGSEIDGLRRGCASRELDKIAPHITLVPPVNVAEIEVEQATSILRAAAQSSHRFEISVGPAATFPPRHHVVYLRVGGDIGDLLALQRACYAGVLVPATGPTSRPFVAHVTLTNRATEAIAHDAVGLLSSYCQTIEIDSLSLLEQRSTDGGSRWEPVGDYALGPPVIIGRGGREIAFSISSRLDPVARRLAAVIPAGPARAEFAVSTARFAVTAAAGEAIVAVATGWCSGRSAELDCLVVEDSHRREGIGGQLASFIERLVAERGAERLSVAVEREGPAEALFVGRGYRSLEDRGASVVLWRAVGGARR